MGNLKAILNPSPTSAQPNPIRRIVQMYISAHYEGGVVLDNGRITLEVLFHEVN